MEEFAERTKREAEERKKQRTAEGGRGGGAVELCSRQLLFAHCRYATHLASLVSEALCDRHVAANGSCILQLRQATMTDRKSSTDSLHARMTVHMMTSGARRMISHSYPKLTELQQL